jgi:pimeloyl-ACP methyl ester carboxylesterase
VTLAIMPPSPCLPENTRAQLHGFWTFAFVEWLMAVYGNAIHDESADLPEGCVRHRLLCANPWGLHEMAFTHWGDPENPDVVLCVHGLTRNGRDFDALARTLARRFRVICPDMVGRGHSDWLPHPSGYQMTQYLSDIMTLLAWLRVPTLDWVGTSMGGLMGLILASSPKTPIRRLMLNDIGPSIESAGLKRIAGYLGQTGPFGDMAEVRHYLRTVCASFGPLSEAQWTHLAVCGTRKNPEGFFLAYDPGIAVSFPVPDQGNPPLDLWPIYATLRLPVLVFRGQNSDLLSAAVFERMQREGPKATGVEWQGVGHAPMLMDEAQIKMLNNFLTSSRALAQQDPI